jgi:hypothetical protein
MVALSSQPTANAMLRYGLVVFRDSAAELQCKVAAADFFDGTWKDVERPE